MKTNEQKMLELDKKPYEEPTLVEREELLQITEGDPIPGISEGGGMAP